VRLHHVQVGCPPGGEELSRRFFVDGLGMAEVAKPAALAGRGGCWFRAHDAAGAVTAEIHVGVEETVGPPRKAHPALLVDDAQALEALAARLRLDGHPVDEQERDSFDGFVRFHTRDPHGNRIEVLAPRP
jgi:catechol 2,3-dioxygenase-like lactoylglutathione lyase family enzyme